VSTADPAVPVSAAEASSLFADLAQAPALVLAVSGGPDSTALLVLAARWRAALARGPQLLAVTVDHGLRPDSAREARAVKRLAENLGVPHRIVRWSGRKPATGLQEAARANRYRLLAAVARQAGARHVLTAHTLDDQAETVLLRLARGSGITGLTGMARSARLHVPNGPFMLMRPLLDIPKARLVATLRTAGISFAEDPSNTDPRFTRARLRALMPILAGEGLDAARLARFAARLRRAEASIELAVDVAASALSLSPWSETSIMLEAESFRRLPDEVALRLLGRAIARVGDEGPVQLGKLEALHAVLMQEPSPKSTDLARARIRRTLAGAVITSAADRLTIARAPPRRAEQKRRRRTLTTRQYGPRKAAKRR
jgi:tRNA(Ile)-lysidine synthase